LTRDSGASLIIRKTRRTMGLSLDGAAGAASCLRKLSRGTSRKRASATRVSSDGFRLPQLLRVAWRRVGVSGSPETPRALMIRQSPGQSPGTSFELWGFPGRRPFDRSTHKVRSRLRSVAPRSIDHKPRSTACSHGCVTCWITARNAL
jgi:hypothetical protein